MNMKYSFLNNLILYLIYNIYCIILDLQSMSVDDVLAFLLLNRM